MTYKSKDKQLNLIKRLVVFCAFVLTAWCLIKLPTPLISLSTCFYLTYSYSNEPYLTNNIWGKLPLLTTLIPRRSTSIYSIFKVGWRNGNAVISIDLSFIISVFKKNVENLVGHWDKPNANLKELRNCKRRLFLCPPQK